MKEAFEKWEDISRGPKVLAEYHSRRMAILDEASVLREAEPREEETRLEGKYEVVRQFLINGLDLDTVCKASGMSRDEIEKVAKSFN